MSKIAIISQPDQGVLIDVSGCTSLKEALEHLSSTLQVSSQFWKGMNVSLNLGKLELSHTEIAQILALAKGVGIQPTGVYTTSELTKESLSKNGVALGTGAPMTLPTVSLDSYNHYSSEVDEPEKKKNNSPIATIKMRVADAMQSRKAARSGAESNNDLEDMDDLEAPRVDGPAPGASPPASGAKSGNFPHVKPRRKVSLDGRSFKGEDTLPPSAPPASEPSTEPDSPVAFLTSDSPAGNTVAAEGKLAKDPAPALAAAADPENHGKCGGEIEVATEVDVDADEALVVECEPEVGSLKAAVATADPDGDRADAAVADADDDFIANADEYDPAESVETVAVEDGPVTGPNTLYLRQNLRSGQTVSHKGNLVIIGDINPGAEVMAEGDITVWGCLRGVAHAGIGGNVNAEIRALKLQPIQIRIAQAIARAPDRPRLSYAKDNGPETARIVGGKIKVFRSGLE